MPVTTETLHNIKRLNVWFAASAAICLGASGWMLWHDFNRPWRHTQREFFNLRSAMAHMDSLAYESPEMKQRRSNLEEAVRLARAELATPANREKERDLLDREKLLTGKSQSVALTYGNMNAELQVMLFNYEEFKTLHGEEDTKAKAARRVYEERSELVAKLKKEQDDLDDALRDVKSQLKALYAKRNEAERVLAAYDKGRADAVRLDKMYGPGLTRTVLNLPGLDYLAPKGVPGREEVQQVFMKSIRFNYNFLDSYVTDRCTTCHTGIDNPAFTLEAFVAKTEVGLTTDAVQAVLKKENDGLMRGFTRRLAEVDVTDFSRTDATLDAAGRENFIRRMVGGANAYLKEAGRPALRPEDYLGAFAADQPLSRGMIEDKLAQTVLRILEARPPTASDGKTAIQFADMTEPQRVEYVAALTAAMNTYLVHEGRPKIDFKKELQAHPHLDLYLSPNSPHPMNKLGCTVCHEGGGQETDFVFAAHTPKDHHEHEEWARKYYVRELGIPLATFELVEEFWERPMLLPGYTSASCRKCHQQTYDLERRKTLPLDSAHRITAGREMFTSVGCINCHAVEGLNDSRRVGTDLTHVGDKLSRGFMERWVNYPKDFRPATWMPHFFHQENNLPYSANEFDPDPVLRTEAEIQGIVHYLRTFSKPFDARPVPEGVQGDAKRGEDLFVSIGCLACHANLEARDPLDSQGRSIGERWITTELMHADGLSEEDAKQRLESMNKNDRSRFAMSRFTEERRLKAIKARDEEELAADREGRDADARKMYVPPVYTRVAPELSGMGTKLVPDANDVTYATRAMQWLYNWLLAPRHYSSYTRMPRMFRDQFYQYDTPEEQRRKNDQDILDVAAYLLTLRNDDFPTTPLQDDSAHLEITQRLILDLLGGQNTRSVAEKILNDEKFSPDEPYGRLTAAIVSQAYRSFGEGDEGRRRIQSMIAQHSPSLESRQRLYLGMKMISHYGCYSCHNIAGFEDATRPGTELTLWAEKFMSQLDFAFYSPPFHHEIENQPELFGKLYIEDEEFAHLARDAGDNPPQEILHNHGSFAYHKLRNPRIWDRAKIKKPYEKLKMPNFFFTDEEARSLVAYLLSLRQANVGREVQIPYDKTPAGKIARGRSLVRELNCIACHVIESNEALVHQYYTKDTSVADTDPRSARFAPPLLWGEGAKVQYDWLYSFLNNVEMLRPWLRVRMPSFVLNKDQTTTLVEYFAGLSQDEARILKQDIEPIVKYLQTVHATVGASGNNEDPSRTPPWYLEEKFAPQADFLRRYSLSKEQTGKFDWPSASPANREEAVEKLSRPFGRAMERAEFLSKVFDVEYPFNDSQSHHMDEARFKLGEEFFYGQKCLACHVAGDPSVPGTTTDIKAPNFALTYKRLRYDWVIKWLQDPQAIQPGANMPQIFQRGASAFAPLPEQDRIKNEEQFGNKMEDQARLLVDFIYNLGERRYTAIQPGGITPDAPAAAPSGTDFDFDGGDEKTPASQPAEDFDF